MSADQKKKNEKSRFDRGFAGVPPSIGQLMEKSLEDGAMNYVMRNRRLFDKFKLVAGVEASKHCSVLAHQLGVLYVRVDSPHWLERLRYLKKDWLKALNTEMGFEMLSDISLKVLPEDTPADKSWAGEYDLLSDYARHYENYYDRSKEEEKD